MLAAKESLKLCETERPAGRGVGGVKTSSGKLRLPSQSGLAPDFTQPFSNLKLFTNTKQEPSSQRKQKMSKKKKRPVQSQRTPKKSGSRPVHRRPLTASRASPSPGRTRTRRPRSTFPPRHRPGAPAPPPQSSAAPQTPPAPVTEYPGIRGHIFLSLPTPNPHKGRNRRTFQKSNLPGAAVALASRHLPPPTPPPP